MNFWSFFCPKRQSRGTSVIALGVCVALVATAIGTPASAQRKGEEPLEVNEAQTLLLLTDHLKKIKKPTTLRYNFTRKSQKDDDSFSDTIDVKITKVNPDGTKDISFDFFTDSRRRPYPDVKGYKTNALVMWTLNRDVWQMARAIGAHAQQANYFSKRINVAVRDGPEVEDVTIDTKNGPIQAKKISVTPFVGDANISKFPQFERKSYEFFFSKDIPGEFYMSRIIVPAGEASKNSGPQIEEVTVYEGQMSVQ